MYFKIFISKRWSERFAGSRRRFIQSFPRIYPIKKEGKALFLYEV